ncbi:MAG: HD domain-containing protein [Synergistaceae bacterium]|nr:HD domain-containing protein [Synergistaceae bacterium]
MWQKNHTFNTLEQALSGLKIIESELNIIPHKDAMLLIFADGVKQEQMKKLIAALNERLPDVKRAGSSGFMNMMIRESGIHMNLILADEPCFFPVQFSCEPGEEGAVFRKFLAEAEKIPNIKAVALYYANSLIDASSVIKNISLKLKDVNIFGTMAKLGKIFSDAVSYDDTSYAIGEDVLMSGFSFMIFAGENLQVYMDYILGWKAIGKEMEIALSDKKVVGESCVTKIENRPAIEIYQKYLGVEWNENFIMNVCEFPLMVSDGDVDVCMIPLTKNNDGELFFLRKLSENETIRFSYATHEEVLTATKEGSERMKQFGAEAVILTRCGNRVVFFGERSYLEYDFYKKINPELSIAYGHCEISCLNGKGGILNSALVAVGFKECKNSQDADRNFVVDSRQYRASDSEGIIPLPYRISHFFSIMTDELLHFQHHLEEEVEIKTRENESLSFHVVLTLADAIDAKDRYTNGHSRRVATYSKEIAKRAGYSMEKQDEIYMMGLLHDVGKIGIPDAVINKPGRLTDEEFERIKLHPTVGAHILSNIKEMPKLAIGAHWHHERFDGRGYPDGLKGYDIPEEARIIAVSDAYDAMTSNRSYRSMMPQEKVRYEIEHGSGFQFDPNFASIMLSMIDDDKNYEMKEK